MLVAIAACEVGFWVFLVLGLLTRYLLRRRRASTVLLLAAPAVDVALLVFTIVDLRRGTPINPTHALAAVYLGFSVAFGHDLITWADRRAAHRWAGGPPPPPKPASGTAERARKEWRDWRHAAAGFVVTGALLGLMALLVHSRGHGDLSQLVAPIPGLATALTIWLIGWPVTESLRARRHS